MVHIKCESILINVSFYKHSVSKICLENTCIPSTDVVLPLSLLLQMVLFTAATAADLVGRRPVPGYYANQAEETSTAAVLMLAVLHCEYPVQTGI